MDKDDGKDEVVALVECIKDLVSCDGEGGCTVSASFDFDVSGEKGGGRGRGISGEIPSAFFSGDINDAPSLLFLMLLDGVHGDALDALAGEGLCGEEVGLFGGDLAAQGTHKAEGENQGRAKDNGRCAADVEGIVEFFFAQVEAILEFEDTASGVDDLELKVFASGLFFFEAFELGLLVEDLVGEADMDGFACFLDVGAVALFDFSEVEGSEVGGDKRKGFLFDAVGEPFLLEDRLDERAFVGWERFEIEVRRPPRKGGLGVWGDADKVKLFGERLFLAGLEFVKGKEK